jgi:hypothetical protein
MAIGRAWLRRVPHGATLGISALVAWILLPIYGLGDVITTAPN